MPAIRAVLFDLGNTLVSYYQPAEFMPILRRSLQACLRTLGAEPLSHEAHQDLLHRALDLNQERADLAVWPLEQRLRVLFAQHSPDTAGVERLTQAFLQPIFATAQVSEYALPVLSALRRRGIVTAIVSNTPWGSAGRAWRSELARHDLLAAVDAVVFCTDVGWRKPHPIPFQRALEILGVAPADAVFVGDDPAWDVEGALSAGIRPILLDGGAALLRSRQVLIASSLPEVVTQVDLLNAASIAGAQPAIA